MQDSQFEIVVEVRKVDAELGVVFGWGIICTQDGEPYVDLQGDNISEVTMLKSSAQFAESARIAKDMHEGGPVGVVPFVFPMTGDIAKALGMTSRQTGMLIGMKLNSPELLAKFKSGEYRGFSVAGRGRRRKVQPA